MNLDPDPRYVDDSAYIALRAVERQRAARDDGNPGAVIVWLAVAFGAALVAVAVWAWRA